MAALSLPCARSQRRRPFTLNITSVISQLQPARPPAWERSLSDLNAITRRAGHHRETRRAARALRTAEKLPYIRRRIPNVELLSSEAVEIIETNAETILEEIGIEFRRDPESLRLWRDAGADVRGERVRIPR